MLGRRSVYCTVAMAEQCKADTTRQAIAYLDLPENIHATINTNTRD